MTMGRIMALDYGRKRIGIAVTDPLRLFASGLTTIPTHEIWNFFNKYFQEEKVDSVVIGYPKNMKNEPSEAVKYIDPFIKAFNKKYPHLSLDIYDERFTSKMAFQAMIDGGLKKKARQDKGMIDKISAAILLESYMEMLKNSSR